MRSRCAVAYCIISRVVQYNFSGSGNRQHWEGVGVVGICLNEALLV